MREIDALVAEKVMGKEVTPNVSGFDGRCGWRDDYGFTRSRYPRNPPYHFGAALKESNANYNRVPFYSTSISAAWEVVEKMGEENKTWIMFDNVIGHLTAYDAKEAACQICYAALTSVGVAIPLDSTSQE